MTATKLMQPYLYRDGEWEALEIPCNDYAFELWNGSHLDDVTLYGHEDGGNRRVTLKVTGEDLPTLSLPATERIKYPTHYSAAYKWSYSHAFCYGFPRTPHDPHVVVLEISEDAFKHPEYAKDAGPVSPYPYAIHVQLGFARQTIFVDDFPDLARLLGEVLPLVGNPPPRNVAIYGLHKWSASWGEFPIE